MEQTPLEANLHHSEKRRLRKCLRAGFIFEENMAIDLLGVYEFIRESRLSRGYTLSLDWDSFQRLFHYFPDACKVFSVKDKEHCVAMTVAIVVNQQTLYNFYPASELAYQHFSPMVLLTQGLYTYCQERAIRLLDLGTAMLGPGKPNYGLMRFKQNLGAETSLKLSFEKVF